MEIKTELRGSIAISNINMTYFNPNPENSMECIYVFPLEKTTIITSFEAIIDDTIVYTKVTEKETAH